MSSARKKLPCFTIPCFRVFLSRAAYFNAMAISIKAGEVFRQPELARTLTRIEQDPGSFYHGALASELAQAIQKHGGLVSKKDLEIYQVKDRKPLTGTYHQYEILAPPPPSSGGIALLEMLNILEGFDLAALGDRTPAIHAPDP